MGQRERRRIARYRARQADAKWLRGELQRADAGRVASVIGTWLSSFGHTGFRLGSCFCPPSAWRCRTMVVEGEADHAKRRVCGIARICIPIARSAFASSPSLTGTGCDRACHPPRSIRSQLMPRHPNGTGSRRATCGASRRPASGRPRSSPSSGCCAAQSACPRPGSPSTGVIGSASRGLR